MRYSPSRTMDFRNMSGQQILDLARPTPEYREIMEVWPPLKIDWSNKDAAVTRIREQTSIAEELDELDPDVEEQYIKAPVRDGYGNSLRIFKSKDSLKPGPLIVLYHGGGCILGSTTMMAETSRWLCKTYNATCIAPAYRLAPEHVFPTALNDAFDSFLWIAKNATSAPISADPSQGFIIGGVSAGANMAIVIAHLARDQSLSPPLTGLYSACGSVRCRDLDDLDPVYRNRHLSRSQQECIANPILSPELQDLMSSAYQPDHSSPLFSPLLWPSPDNVAKKGGHHNLVARVYQQICGRDPARDESLIFDDILRQKDSGVEAKMDFYAGMPHCFWIALRHLPESDRWERETVEGFGWLLGKR